MRHLVLGLLLIVMFVPAVTHATTGEEMMVINYKQMECRRIFAMMKTVEKNGDEISSLIFSSVVMVLEAYVDGTENAEKIDMNHEAQYRFARKLGFACAMKDNLDKPVLEIMKDIKAGERLIEDDGHAK